MKRIFKYMLIGMFPLISAAQSVPNGDFELWNIVDYSIPDLWNTSAWENLDDAGIVATTRVSGHINSAIRLETMFSDNELIQAYFSNTDGDPLAGEGGMPYNGSPTAITGYYRYHLPALDTALMIVICKLDGSISSFDLFKIKGTGEQPEFTEFNFSLSNDGPVDTVIIAATSSNLIAEQGIEAGSWIEFDELAFIGVNAMPEIPNGSFDNWSNYTWDRPSGWNSRGRGIERITDSYSNSYAIQLINQTRDDGSLEPSATTTSEINEGPPTGGLPFSNQLDTLCGYYKFIAPPGQFAAISAMIYSNGININGNYQPLAPTSEYTYFELPLYASEVPDTLGIEITSAAWPFDAALEGNTLIVDHLQLKSSPLNILNFSNNKLLLFPNPVRNELTILLSGQIDHNQKLYIYDRTGKCVSVLPIYQTQSTIDTSFLTNGVYTYKLNTANSNYSGQFLVVK